MITSGVVSIALPGTEPTLIYETPRGVPTQIILNTLVVDANGAGVTSNVALVVGDSNIFYDPNGNNWNTVGIHATMPYTSTEFTGALYAVPMYSGTAGSVLVSFTAFDTK